MRRHQLFWGFTVGLSNCMLLSWAVTAWAEVRIAFLASGESEIYEGYFLADEDIFANCDEPCEDFDIYLYDADTEELIDSDTLIDANPIVTAPHNGNFLVETVMVTCNVDICEAWTDSDEGFYSPARHHWLRAALGGSVGDRDRLTDKSSPVENLHRSSIGTWDMLRIKGPIPDSKLTYPPMHPSTATNRDANSPFIP